MFCVFYSAHTYLFSISRTPFQTSRPPDREHCTLLICGLKSRHSTIGGTPIRICDLAAAVWFWRSQFRNGENR